MFVLCCRTIYEKLANAFTEEQAVLYNQRVEEISPNIRYCAYNIGKGRGPHLFTGKQYWFKPCLKLKLRPVKPWSK